MAALQEKTIYTDVLVIGAGGAGLRAAIEAKAYSVDVLVVCKGKFQHDCNSAVAGGAMLAPLGEDDSPEKYARDTMVAGAGANYSGLVQVLARDAAKRAMDLERFGAKFPRNKDTIRLYPSGDNSVDRVLPYGVPYSGDWFQNLVNEAHRLEIGILEQFHVMNLLVDGGTVVGAAGFVLENGLLVMIFAKSVILATGGAGNLYTFSSNQKTITGDGMVMAYNAGAPLSHLEFMQMRQCIVYPLELKGMLPPFDGFISAGGRFYNGLHERYMRRYHPEKLENVTRAEIARCAQLEISAGRQAQHGGVYGDLSGVPLQTLLRVKKFIDACSAVNFDPSFQSFEWAPASHYTMGGVVVNPHCQTGVLGLFAAGEVVAGVQGANRIGGNALTETQVFGAIAGAKAAERARTIALPQHSPHHAMKAQKYIQDIRARRDGTSCVSVKSRLTTIMSSDVGVIRHEDGMQNAKKKLNELQGIADKTMYLGDDRSFHQLAHFLEVSNLLTLSSLMVQASLTRTETRGSHQRLDYPEISPDWNKHIVFRKTLQRTAMVLLPAQR